MEPAILRDCQETIFSWTIDRDGYTKLRVMEAMSSHRPYRPSLGIDHALAELSRDQGTLYDPGVVDALIGLQAAVGWDTLLAPGAAGHVPLLPRRAA